MWSEHGIRWVPDISGVYGDSRWVAHDDWRIPSCRIRAQVNHFHTVTGLGVSTGGLARTCVRTHRHEIGCPTFRGARSVGIPAADGNRCSNRASSFPPAQPSRCASVTAQPCGSTVYLRHAQSPAPLLWRGILAFHHHSCYQRLLLLGSPRKRDMFLRVLEPAIRSRLGGCLRREQWEWSSFRHYAYSEPGPVMINEPQKAELRIRKNS